MESLQDKFAPNSICFGCGPKNPQGLHIKSVPDGETLVADWKPQPYHAAFSDFASGGIISVLLDCHGNWTAAYFLMRFRGLSVPPATVTAEYTVRFLSPTPLDKSWHFKAWPTKIHGDKVFVQGEVEASCRKRATMSGLFVAVKKDHPAFHRWQ